MARAPIPEEGTHPVPQQDCVPGSTSNDVDMAAPALDWRQSGVMDSWLREIQKVTEADDNAAAQMLAARERELPSIQKAAKAAAVYAKAEFDRKYQEANARWDKLHMEQEAEDERDWADMEELESRHQENWDQQMEVDGQTWGEQDAQMHADISKTEALLAESDQWRFDEADVNAEYMKYEATVEEEGCWAAEMAQMVEPENAYEDDEGGIRRILFS
jgi:hypothetical protein